MIGWHIHVATVAVTLPLLESIFSSPPTLITGLKWPSEVPTAMGRRECSLPHGEETEPGHSTLWDSLSCLYIKAVTMTSNANRCLLLYAICVKANATLVPRLTEQTTLLISPSLEMQRVKRT